MKSFCDVIETVILLPHPRHHWRLGLRRGIFYAKDGIEAHIILDSGKCMGFEMVLLADGMCSRTRDMVFRDCTGITRKRWQALTSPAASHYIAALTGKARWFPSQKASIRPSVHAGQVCHFYANPMLNATPVNPKSTSHSMPPHPTSFDTYDCLHLAHLAIGDDDPLRESYYAILSRIVDDIATLAEWSELPRRVVFCLPLQLLMRLPEELWGRRGLESWRTGGLAGYRAGVAGHRGWPRFGGGGG